MKVFLLVFILVGISACNSENPQLIVIKNHCLTKMKGTDKFCNCMSEKANKNLSDKQIDFIVIGFTGDKDQANEIRKSMSVDEITHMGDFMRVAITSCTEPK